MMLVMPQSRMRDLLQHVTKIHRGSVNNLLVPLTLLVPLPNTRGCRQHFTDNDLKLVYAEVY